MIVHVRCADCRGLLVVFGPNGSRAHGDGPPGHHRASPARSALPAPTTARYRVVFDSTWSASTYPTDFPDTAHYSGLIGGTHGPSVSFWAEGSVASEGIRQMAERGRKSPLDAEVQQAISAGLAEHLLSGPELDMTPSSASMEFDISRTFPLVTLVSMIAPTPTGSSACRPGAVSKQPVAR